MKHFNEFIIEKFKINSDNISKENKYQYTPKSKSALISAIKSVINSKENEGTEKDPYNLNIIDTSKVKDMSLLFGFDRRWGRKPNGQSGYIMTKSPIYNLVEDKYLDVSNWNVSNVENFSRMFQHANLKNFIGLENWQPNLEDAGHYAMFANLYLCDENDVPDWCDKNDRKFFNE